MSLIQSLIPYLPQQTISRLYGILGRLRQPAIKNWLIERYIKHYQVDLSEAIKQSPEEFIDFNAFFTRALQPDARPLAPESDAIISPADGTLSAWGEISNGLLIQAKNHDFRVADLLACDEETAQGFEKGHFLTTYLAPRDYHRVHMPYGGQLKKMTYVPGQLFSVNQRSVETVPQLFSRNERVVCWFETDRGPMIVILVGAIIVASIHTAWAGAIAPRRPRTIKEWDYPAEGPEAITLAKGDEVGHFCLGSTAIILFGPNQIQWDENLSAQQPLQFGQRLGQSHAK